MVCYNAFVRFVALLVFTATAACSAPTPGPVVAATTSGPLATTTRWSVPASDTSDVGNACREEAADLKDWLHEIRTTGQPVTLSLLDDGSRLLDRAGEPIVEAAPLLHLRATATLLDGVAVRGPTAIRDGLARLIERRHNMTPKSPFLETPVCHLAVDRGVRWAVVSAALQQLVAAGVTRVTFVFHNPRGKLPPIPPSAIDNELRRLRHATSAKRQQVVAELLAHVYQNCSEGLKVIAKMGANELADFKQIIVAELPAAVESCGCAPEVASVKALHWELFGQPNPIAGISITLATPKHPAKSTILIAPEVPWKVAGESIDGVRQERMQPVGFGTLDGPAVNETAPEKKR